MVIRPAAVPAGQARDGLLTTITRRCRATRPLAGPGASLLARRSRVLQQSLPGVDGPPLGFAAFRAAEEFTRGRGACWRSPAYSRKRRALSMSLVAESPALLRHRPRRRLPHEEVAHPPHQVRRRLLAGRALLQYVLGEPFRGVRGLAQGPPTGPVREPAAAPPTRRRQSLPVGRLDGRLSDAPWFARAHVGHLSPTAVTARLLQTPPSTKHAKCHASPPSRFHGLVCISTPQVSVCKGLVLARPAQDNTRGSPPGDGVVRWSGVLFPANPDI